MAHHLKTKITPHINKDGSNSIHRKNYTIIDRTRGKLIEVGVVTSQKAADELIDSYREKLKTR